MSQLSDELVDTAIELINEFGGTVTIDYQNRDPVYNPATSTYSGGTAVPSITPKALIEDKGTWIDGQVKGEKKITISADGITKPEAGDKFTITGETFTVMLKGVVTSYVEDVPVIYEVFGVK